MVLWWSSQPCQTRSPIIGLRALPIDVYDIEPLPENHPYRRIESLLATPHIGFVSRGLYQRFYQDTVDNVLAWLRDYKNSG